MQIQPNVNPMDHHLTPTSCHHTKTVRIKMFHKCIPKLNGECVGNETLYHLFSCHGSDATIPFL